MGIGMTWNLGGQKEKGRADSYEILQGVGAPFFPPDPSNQGHSDNRNCADKKLAF